MCTLGRRWYTKCSHSFWTVHAWCEQKKRHGQNPGAVPDCTHFLYDEGLWIPSPPEEAHLKCRKCCAAEQSKPVEWDHLIKERNNRPPKTMF
ncbi:hypothetical protein LZ30DRAFT_382327 [Colletotrichum cereale]|nr:hypothetical protein LZ30DRAFT_382327 [Colletotrichum cereale]